MSPRSPYALSYGGDRPSRRSSTAFNIFSGLCFRLYVFAGLRVEAAGTMLGCFFAAGFQWDLNIRNAFRKSIYRLCPVEWQVVVFRNLCDYVCFCGTCLRISSVPIVARLFRCSVVYFRNSVWRYMCGSFVKKEPAFGRSAKSRQTL